MTEKVLFIGGCADGKWLDRPTSEYHVVTHPALLSFTVRHSSPLQAEALSDLYRMERIRSGKKEWECWVLDSLSPEDFIERLIDGYSKAKTTP